jgi:cation diffusion facilitator family transporter
MVERMGWCSIAVNVTLILLNVGLAVLSGSLALAAETIHNVVDLIASIAILAGLKLSHRKSREFPYGLYKVENVVAVIIALLIFFTGYEIAKEALFAAPREVTVNPLMLGGVIVAAVIPLVFSRYELQVGQEANSPSLIADAREFQAHVLSSGVVFAALVGQLVGWPLDRAAAVAIVLFVTKTGWELLADGMRVLLDASLDAETLAQVRQIIEAEPSVAEVKRVLGRNAGRYRFIEAEIILRIADLEKAYAISSRIEGTIRAQVPHVDRVLIHYEPLARTHLRYAVPLADAEGTISQHFGEAPTFALVTVRASDGGLEKQEVVANPHTEVLKAKGIRVAEWLVGQKVDVVLTPESLKGKGPTYVLADAGVEMRATTAATLNEVLSEIRESERGGDTVNG